MMKLTLLSEAELERWLCAIAEPHVKTFRPRHFPCVVVWFIDEQRILNHLFVYKGDFAMEQLREARA